MQLKDYYKTLALQPTATATQIKKSFRQLALIYHPDKNPGNATAEARFREIQEAYETLGHPEKREEYNYKRWYNRSINASFVHEPLDPAAVLQECIRLNTYLHTVSAMRVDFDGLSYHIRELLGDKNIGILQQFDDPAVNAGVIEQILQSASMLPFKYIPQINTLLQRVAGTNQEQVKQIKDFEQHQKQQHLWQKYRVVIVIVVTLFICWMIYVIGK